MRDLRSHHRQNVAATKKNIFSALIEEYKILKSEASDTLEASNRAISYIQVYGLFIILLAGAYFNGLRIFLAEDQRHATPQSLWLVTICAAAVFLFLLYSHITHTSFKFRILRARMAKIESQVNDLLHKEVFLYERQVAARSFSHTAIDSTLLTPAAWTRLFTTTLFGLAVAILILLSRNMFVGSSADYLLFSSGTIIFVAVTLLIDDFRINKFLDIETVVFRSASKPSSIAVLVPYLTNYVAFMLIFYTLFASALASPSHSFIVRGIDQLFAWLEAVDWRITLIFVFLYDALCGAFLFTPSELPLRLEKALGLLPILVAAAFGKAFGSVLLFSASRWWLFRSLGGVTRRLRLFSENLLTKFPGQPPIWLVYSIIQSIPFAPMRIATIAYAAIAPDGVRPKVVVALGSGFGTVSRMLILWGIAGATT